MRFGWIRAARTRVASEREGGARGEAWRDACAVAVMIAGTALFHARGLWPGATFLPVDLAGTLLPWRGATPPRVHNPLVSDPLYEFYPFVATAAQALHRTGRLLEWNPWLLLGHPAIADPLAQSFYPGFVAFALVFGAARGLALAGWAHAAFAAVCTYGWLRAIGRRRTGAVLGAFTYALGGYMVNWFELTYWLGTLSWLPAVLWAHDLAVRHRRWRYVALGGIALAVAILAGHLQLVVDFGLFYGLYALGQAALQRRLWPLAAGSGTVVLASLLSAVQTVPFAQALALSIRPGAQRLADSLPASQLVTLLVPKLFGTPAGGEYWGALNYLEGTAYAGLPALVLAAIAPRCAFTTSEPCSGPRRPGSPRGMLAYVALLGVLVTYFATGGPGVALLDAVPLVRYGSLHRAIFLLPLIVAFLASATLGAERVWLRAAVAVAAAIVLLIGWALVAPWGHAAGHWPELRVPLLRAAMLLGATLTLLAMLVRRRGDLPPRTRHAGAGQAQGKARPEADPSASSVAHPSLPRRWLPAFLGPVVRATVGIPPWLPRGRWLLEVALVALVFVDLYIAGSRFNPAGPVAALLPPVPAVDYLQAQSAARGGVWRIAALQTSDVPLFGPNVLSLFGVAEAGGYTSVVPARLVALVDAGDPKDDAPGIGYWLKQNRNIVFFSHPSPRLLDLLGVDAVVAPPGAAPPGDVAGTGTWLETYRGAVSIWERREPWPRAFVVYGAEPIPDEAAAVRRLLDPAFDPRRTAVTAEPLALPREGPVPGTPASILSYSATAVVIEANAAQAGLLVLADAFFPGWEAAIDGRPAPVQRVDDVLRGVVLPAGQHRVIFHFVPAGLRRGALVSLAGLALAGLLVLLDGRAGGWMRRRAEARHGRRSAAC